MKWIFGVIAGLVILGFLVIMLYFLWMSSHFDDEN